MSRPGIEPGPAAWQTLMLPLAQQRWTKFWYQFRTLYRILNIITYPLQFISNSYTEEMWKYNLSYYKIIQSFIFWEYCNEMKQWIISKWMGTVFLNLISLFKFNLPLIGTFTWPTPPGPYKATTCRVRELNYRSHIYLLTTQGYGEPPRMSDQPNAGATSETAQTWKTINTKHTLSHANKAKMEWWWRRPNDIRGPWGPKVSWHLCYRWGKTPKKISPRKLVPTGDRTRARCVTSAHATTCSTAVDTAVVN